MLKHDWVRWIPLTTSSVRTRIQLREKIFFSAKHWRNVKKFCYGLRTLTEDGHENEIILCSLPQLSTLNFRRAKSKAFAFAFVFDHCKWIRNWKSFPLGAQCDAILEQFTLNKVNIKANFRARSHWEKAAYLPRLPHVNRQLKFLRTHLFHLHSVGKGPWALFMLSDYNCERNITNKWVPRKPNVVFTLTDGICLLS